MEFPLSEREQKRYNELVEIYKDTNGYLFKGEEYQKYADLLKLLIEQGALINMNSIYYLSSPNSLHEFEAWINDQDKKAKKIKVRDLKSGILCALAGGVLGIVLEHLVLFIFRMLSK